MRLDPPKVAVLIPYSSDEPERGAALAYILRWWKQFGFEVIVGTSNPYTKGNALAEALKWAHPHTELLIVADADCVVSPASNVLEALELAEAGQWVVPYQRVWRLTQEETAARLAGQPAAEPATICSPYRPCLGGGIVVLPKPLWTLVGGIDSAFQGWGGEDRSFGYALETLAGAAAQLPGRLIHLWHREQGPRRPMSRETIALVNRYRTAWRNPMKMRRLIAEREAR